MLVVLGNAAQALGSTGLVTFLPRFIENELCKSKSVAAVFTAAMVLMGAASFFIGGVIVDKCKLTTGQQLLFMTVTQAIGLPVHFVWTSRDATVFMPVFLVAIIPLYMWPSPMLNVLNRLAESGAEAGDSRTDAQAIANTCQRLFGAIPGPIILGVMLDAHSVGGGRDGWNYTVVGGGGCILTIIFWGAAYCVHRVQGHHAAELDERARRLSPTNAAADGGDGPVATEPTAT